MKTMTMMDKLYSIDELDIIGGDQSSATPVSPFQPAGLFRKSNWETGDKSQHRKSRSRDGHTICDDGVWLKTEFCGIFAHTIIKSPHTSASLGTE